MGYDDCECLGCYCIGGGNNRVDDKYNTCLECIGNLCGSGATGRVVSVLKNNDWDYKETCERCEKSNIITIHISLCDSHKNISEEENSHEHESELNYKIIKLSNEIKKIMEENNLLRETIQKLEENIRESGLNENKKVMDGDGVFRETI